MLTLASCRRTYRDVVCITPASMQGTVSAPVHLMIDKAEVTNTEINYTYTEDPTITGIEPSWTILKSVLQIQILSV